MLFNSIEFAVFLPIVFLFYWFVLRNSYKKQNVLLLFASYFFYGWWDYRFLFLLMFSTFLDYFTGLKMQEANLLKKRFWFWLSIGINLGFLGVFKYYNFFVNSFAEAASGFGFQPNITTLQILLPVGISFYTFHGLSYVIDIYYGRITPVRNFIDYSVFVSFFPLLVAGPIERATHLLPQIQKPRTFEYYKAVDGLRQILWGLFKKIVIADNAAAFANDIFKNYDDASGSTLFFGAFFFAFQIYCDFSGYSDIALGTARLFGFELLRNFSFPYFSRDIAEFWRRWHISLSTWFRDYVYLPLGGSRGGTWMKIRNTFIIFLLSGFWHGANWTFIAWGFINACYFMPLLLLKANRVNTNTVAEGKLLPSVKEFFQMSITFFLTLIAWVFFRANTITEAFYYLKGMFTRSWLTMPVTSLSEYSMLITLMFIFLVVIIEWLQRDKKHALEFDKIQMPVVLRWSIYYCIVIALIAYSGSQQDFIYFAF
jgi:alginate O-acetyltransferase complex protein AlgI